MSREDSVIDAAADRWERAVVRAQLEIARMVERALKRDPAAKVARLVEEMDFEALLLKAGYQAEAQAVAAQMGEVLRVMQTRGRLTETTLRGLTRTFAEGFLSEVRSHPAQLKAATVQALYGGGGSATIREALAGAIRPDHARTLADTALRTYSRSVQREMAEADPPGTRYVYAGPNDDRTREVCQEMLNAGALTLEEIDQRFPGRFSRGGGHNCRHTWQPEGAV
jgi:hypothetical protein